MHPDHPLWSGYIKSRQNLHTQVKTDVIGPKKKSFLSALDKHDMILRQNGATLGSKENAKIQYLLQYSIHFPVCLLENPCCWNPRTSCESHRGQKLNVFRWTGKSTGTSQSRSHFSFLRARDGKGALRKSPSCERTKHAFGNTDNLIEL